MRDRKHRTRLAVPGRLEIEKACHLLCSRGIDHATLPTVEPFVGHEHGHFGGCPAAVMPLIRAHRPSFLTSAHVIPMPPSSSLQSTVRAVWFDSKSWHTSYIPSISFSSSGASEVCTDFPHCAHHGINARAQPAVHLDALPNTGVEVAHALFTMVEPVAQSVGRRVQVKRMYNLLSRGMGNRGSRRGKAPLLAQRSKDGNSGHYT